MTDFFEDVSVEEFALPGDDARLGRVVEETPVEEAPERPRNERGQFVAAEETPAEEPAAEETPEVVAEEAAPEATDSDPELEQYLAKYGGDQTKALKAAVEAQKLIGRQGAELAEYRQTVEQRFDQLDQRLSQPTPAPPVQLTPDMIEQNPAYAAQLAYEQDNGVAFQMAFEAWKEEDPFGAATWATAKKSEHDLAELRAEQTKQIEELRSTIAPANQAAQSQQVAALTTQEAVTHPGLVEFVQSNEVASLAAEFPEEGELIITGSPEQKVRALSKLFQIHRGRASDTHRATQEQVARQTAEAAQQVRDEAFVASASTTSSDVQPTAAEKIGAEWDAMEAVHSAGWNV